MNSKLLTKKKTFKLAGSLTAISCWSLATLLPLCAFAEERTGMIGGKTISFDLTPEQATKADALSASVMDRFKQLVVQMNCQQWEVDQNFYLPTPNRQNVFGVRADMDKELHETHSIILNYALKVRAMLTPQQRENLGLLKPSEFLTGIKLSNQQLQTYNKLLRTYLNFSLDTDKKLANLQLEQEFLLQEMDLVHGCHLMELDEPALIALQKQINELNSARGLERVKVAAAVHNLLTQEQRQALSKSASMKVPDPIGEKLREENTTTPPSAEQEFPHAKLSKEQVENYNNLVSKHQSNFHKFWTARNNLVAQQRALLNKSALDEPALIKFQREINELDDDEALDKIHQIVQVRDVLTQEQRRIVYNRHHPKIWNDTGINAQQDQRIMNIHMKLEQADRDGRRKMTPMAADLLKLFYEPGANDEEIIALQNAYDKAQAETIHNELICIFENRDVLTDEQRKKLVELMLAENNGWHE